jgi:OOP family OmpA-OmpF porin
MNKRAATLGLLAAMVMTPASAETGFYFGGSLGNATFDGTAPGTNVSIDDDDTAYKLYGGFRVLSFLAVEGGYVNFGELGGATGTVELDGWDAFGVVNLPLGPVNVFAKLGGIAWQSDFSNAVSSADDSDFDLAYGVGAAFRMGMFGLRAEYEIFETGNDNTEMFSIGAEVNF